MDGRPAADGARSVPRVPRGPRRQASDVPPDVVAALQRALSVEPPSVVHKATSALQRAVDAYDGGRYQDALRIARTAADLAPEVAATRQVAGLAAYRSGRWRDAIRHLQAYREITGDQSLVPQLMDSARAAGRRSRVRALWTEVRQSSPEPEVLAEARIVAAACLADEGSLDGAISLLAGAGAGRSVRNPADRHIRQWYVLADLYERAGDVPAARQLFTRVVRADPDAYDALERLEALGSDHPRHHPPRRRQRAGGPADDPPPAG